MTSLKYAPRSAGRQTGFSLIEILIVVGLIAVIGAFAANQIFGGQATANYKLSQSQLSALASKVEAYQLDTGEYPNSLDDLVKNPGNVQNWLGPYIKEEQLKDAFNTPIAMRAPGENGPFELISLGADKREGGEGVNADIRKP